jgi:DNA polymerase-1
MPAGAKKGCMYLVDAHSLIFQVFHAIPAMSSPTGLPTNALYGFTRDLLFLRSEKRPDYLLCVFDQPGKTFRDEIYTEYKAHRGPPPDDLQLQIPEIYRLLEAMRLPILGQAGYEADDVIATVAAAAAKRGLDVCICTNDKDCRQLIDDRVCLVNLRKKSILDRAALLADWGIAPEQVIDLQTLVGDSVDNVPGVPGIGLKTAAKLLQEFGTLDNIVANIDRIPGAKKQENLRAAADRIQLGRQLVRLETDVPMAMDWEAWRLRDWDAPGILSLFQEWGFRGLADQVRASVPGPSVVRSKKDDEDQASLQGELFPFGANETAEAKPQSPKNGRPRATGHGLRTPGQVVYHLIDTPARFQEFLQQLHKPQRFAVDLETTSLNAVGSELIGLAFSWQSGEAWYVALRAPEGEATLDVDTVLRELAPILEDPTVAKVNQNIKYDLIALRNQGIALAGVAGDPMVADYLLHAGERSHSMADLASRYLQHAVIPIADLIGKGKNQLRLDQVPAARVAEYSGEDADMGWRLCQLLEAELQNSGLDKLYRELEVPLIEVLGELEYNGIRLDVPRLRELSDEMTQQLASIEREIYELAGREFNIASPMQLRDVLFKELRLPTQRRTGITGEASTNQDTLERLAGLGHSLPKKIIEHRQIAKLKGTYVDALPGLIDPKTNRVHASFNQTVAATGRLSSSDPNLQNIPVRTEQGRQIRQAFLPAGGWVLLTADYSQIELRLLAHFCGDEELRRIFAADGDIHASVAAQIFGLPESEVAPEMRRLAKVVNFGVLYGMSAHGLAQRLGMPRDDAARFIDAYFARYPKVLDYQSRLLERCRKLGYVSTILGRRRAITGIRPRSTYQQRNQPEREAVNMEIQGSAADLIKLAMLHIHRRLHDERRQARMLLQIHDELVFEVPPEELEAVTELVREEMTTPLEKSLGLEAPLKVDLAAGANWLDVEDVELVRSP